MKLKDTLKKVNNGLRICEESIVIFSTFAMAILLVTAVFFRKVLNNSLTFSEELGTALVILMTYIGSVYAVRGGKHIIMNMLVDALPLKAKKVLVMISHLLTAAFMFCISVFAFKYMMSAYQLGRITSALRIPYWITLVPMVVGLFFTGVQFLIAFLMNVADKDDIYVGSERSYSEQQQARDN